MDFEREDLLSHLRQIDEYDFEEFIAKLWKRYGWETEVTSGSNDRGIDIVAEKHKPFEQKHLVQVKRWGSGNTVGGPDIQQYSSLIRSGNGIDAVVVVTTSSFSRQAEELAGELNVKLVDGSNLYKILSEVGAEDLVKQYTSLGKSAPESKANSTSNNEEQTPYIEAEDKLNLIFNNIKREISKHRSEVSGHKYNTDQSLKISFLDSNGDICNLSLHYSAIYHNAADFSIQVEHQKDMPEEIVNKIRNTEGIDQVWMKDSSQIGAASTQGDVSPECHAISKIIHRFCLNFSEGDKLYFDETIPDSEIPSTDESSNSEDNMSGTPRTRPNRTNQRDEFEIEKEFHDMR